MPLTATKTTIDGDLFEALTKLHLVLTIPWAYTVVGLDLTTIIDTAGEAILRADRDTSNNVADLMELMASHRDTGPCDADCPARLEVVLYPDDGASDIRVCGRVVQGRVEPRWWPQPF